MKILVTGGAGFIGSHIVKQLLEAGNEVVVYDDFSSSSRTGVDPRAVIIEGRIQDLKLLTESLLGVDSVIHMASYIAVEESVKDPIKYFENNIMGTASLLESMRGSGVKNIVFSSSATVYGEPETLPILEDAPLSAANPYAASKIAMEVMCESFYQTDGFNVTILRYFNPYGPGENHDPETHAIPNFILSGIKKEPVPLYWKGEQIRDFIYVEDLAAAHVAVLNLTGYNVFNVGTEAGTKIIDVINILSEIFGYTLEIKDLGDRKGDVMANYASSNKLKTQTGWEAKIGLKEGLLKTVEWFKTR